MMAAALMLPACSTRFAANQPIQPSYAAPEAAAGHGSPLDPDRRLFLNPVTLTAAPTD